MEVEPRRNVTFFQFVNNVTARVDNLIYGLQEGRPEGSSTGSGQRPIDCGCRDAYSVPGGCQVEKSTYV